MTQPKAELLHGTLDMLILKALSLGPLHGYGIIRARFYTLTKAGGKQLTAEEESWDRLALAIAKVRKAV